MEKSHLRVALDLTPLIAGDTGVARYAAELYRRVAASPGIEARGFTVGRGPDPGVPAVRVRWPLRAVHPLWRWTGWPRAETIVGAVDVVHSIDVVAPPSRAALVATVHDALPLTHPQWYSRRHRRIAETRLATLGQARVVTTTCAATAQAVAGCTGLPAEEMVIAAPGPRLPAAGGAGTPPFAEPYVLAVGAITPRKGFTVLARALARLGSGRPLVVVAGPAGWRHHEVRREVAALGLGASLRFLERVDDDSLDRLYRHAAALCHPSLAEGFGMPCLEAMAQGVPVVAADIPPVREVTSGAAALVRPGDEVALAEALEAVLADDARRQRMAEAGRRRAARYSWDDAAAAVVGAYHRAGR